MRIHLLSAATLIAVAALVAPATPALAADCVAIPAVAHRGGIDKYDENTRNAFRYSSSLGVKWWETDVHFDSAGTPFIIHDDTLDRTTNETGAVSDHDLSADRAAGLRTKDGQVVPSLYEVMTDAEDLDAHVFVEIKDNPTPTEMAKVLARFDWTNMRTKVVVTSFDEPTLAVVKAAAPDLKLGLIENPSYRPVGEITALGVTSYLKHYYSITAARLDEWSGPLDVYAWTVDSATEWARMHWYTSEPGRLDGVITDYPAAYLNWEKTHGC